MASAAMLGPVSGSMTLTKVCHLLQPSRYAASATSLGMPRYACRKKKVPKALTRPGNTSAKMELVAPIFASIWYCGIMKIWLGSIIWISTRLNSSFLQGNSSLAKA